MYHPAAALHQQSLKATIEQDFARLPEMIARRHRPPSQRKTKRLSRPKRPSNSACFELE